MASGSAAAGGREVDCLRVYSILDATSPNVAVQVWYDVGAKDDPEGRQKNRRVEIIVTGLR